MEWIICLVCFLPMFVPVARSKHGKPNVIILLADDLGYGDLGVYGHPTSSTPNLDAMARDGLLFTQFYSAASVCAPSRAALLTGRYQIRAGVLHGYGQESVSGLEHNEVTIAEVLKEEGYRTAIIGKWHLGVGSKYKYRPMHQGFDYYLGITGLCRSKFCFYPDVHCSECDGHPAALIEQNDTILEQPPYLPEVTSRYVTAAKHFIKSSVANEKPFFLYLPFNHVHHPQFAGKEFTGTTLRGTFGDSLAELDWGVGQILHHVRKAGIESNTFIFFTSDNGPTLSDSKVNGSPGLLRCGKGTTWDGGMRMPAIAYWPGRIHPRRTTELASTLDLLPTIAKITGARGPSKDVVLDGVDMSPILFNTGKSKRDTFVYYPSAPDPKFGIYAIRWRQYKAHYYTQGSHCGKSYPDKMCHRTTRRQMHDPPLLYNLEEDPGERTQLDAKKYAHILKKINKVKKEFESKMNWGKFSSTAINQDLLMCAKPNCSPKPSCCKKDFDQDYEYNV